MSDFTFGAFRYTSHAVKGGMAAGLVARIGQMLRARATRRMLADMDDRMLADVGMGRGDALHEAGRPMWDLVPRRR